MGRRSEPTVSSMTKETCIFSLECESREADLAAERTCRMVARLDAPDRDDYWLAEVSPPFIGQHFGLDAGMLTEVIVATRFKGQSVADAKSASIPVYVARILDQNVLATHKLMAHQLQVILWGQLKSSGRGGMG